MNWEALLSHPLPWIVALVGAGIRVGKVNSQSSTFTGFMQEIRDDIRDVRKDIKGILLHLRPDTVASGSPLRLTDLGRSISETLGASAWAAESAEKLVDQVADAPAYDIQEFAFEYVGKEHSLDDAMKAMSKQCAYEHGLKHKQVLDVLAIELRDRLLRLRQLEPPEHHRGQ